MLINWREKFETEIMTLDSFALSVRGTPGRVKALKTPTEMGSANAVLADGKS